MNTNGLIEESTNVARQTPRKCINHGKLGNKQESKVKIRRKRVINLQELSYSCFASQGAECDVRRKTTISPRRIDGERGS